MRNSIATLSWRFLTARRLRTLASIISITLSIALMSALLTLNSSMERSVDAYLLRAHGAHDLMAIYGEVNKLLSDEDLAYIQSQPGVETTAGLLLPYLHELEMSVVESKLFYYGITDTPLGHGFRPITVGAFPGPGEVAVSEAWAEEFGVAIGQVIELPFPPGDTRTVKVSGLLSTASHLPVGLAVFEHAWLAEATKRTGYTGALIDLTDGYDPAHLTAALGERYPDLNFDLRKFLDDARQNLNALRPVALGMGLAALLAALFLLVGAFRMSLTERMREVAMLRAIGAVPAQVRRMMLTEGVWVGMIGSVIGVLLGALAAAAGAGAVARLLETEPGPPVFPWVALAAVALGGILLSVLAALGVARSASRMDPLLAMRPDLPAQAEAARRGGWLGIALLILGAVALAVSPFLPAEPDFLTPLAASTGGLAIGLGLLLGLQRLLPFFLSLLGLPFRRSVEGPVAVRSLLRHRRRSGNTVAAMGLSLILVVSILTMSGSLIEQWYQQVYDEHPTDLVLAVPRVAQRGANADLAQQIAEIPGVTKVAAVGEPTMMHLHDWDWSKADPAWLQYVAMFDQANPEGTWRYRDLLMANPVSLPDMIHMELYTIVEGSLEHWGDGALAITQAAAVERGMSVGDTLTLNVAQGNLVEATANPVLKEYQVVAIVEDLTRFGPQVMIGAPVPGTDSLVRRIYANTSPEQLSAVRDAVQLVLQDPAYGAVEYSDWETASEKLRAQINQRFALLIAVVVVMAIVAVMSLINTMASSVAERRREFAMLRSVGATPKQVRNQILLEAGLLGLVGGLIGVTGGAILGSSALTGLGLALGRVQLPWAVMALGVAVSAGLACLAALGPARGALRLAPAVAVRAE